MVRHCKNCDDVIPNWVKIDGKLVGVHTRRYCLKCVPYGSPRGYSKIYRQRNIKFDNKGDPELKNCPGCGKKYKPDRHTYDICWTCKVSKKRLEIKIKAINYKGGKCKICGYDGYIGCLEFHHRDSSEKDFKISGSIVSEKRLFAELDKCDMLCSNCHQEVHGELLGNGSYIKARDIIYE